MIAAASIQEAKRALDLAAIVEAAGVELRPAGAGRLRGLCPFHAERTPSFFVFQDRQRWRCFGCGAGGDAIDFIRRARGCSFPEALAFLGLNDPVRSAAELSRLKSERRQRETDRWRLRELTWTLGKAIRLSYVALRRITPENFDSPEFALTLDQLPILEHQHQVLIDGDPADCAELMRELSGLRPFARRLLFRPDFDFSGWCRKICYGVPLENHRQPGGAARDSE